MMIDLNGKEFNQEVSIFNNGNAGLVKNVSMTVNKREPSEPETYPDYKVVFTDEFGSVNQGFYYFTPNPQDSVEKQKARQKQEISRLTHLAKAVLGKDAQLPSVNSIKEAYDTVFSLIAKNVGDKKFNVFVTFGTTGRPNKKGYLGVRYFDFIEPAGPTSRLRAKASDLMERIEPDAPNADGKTVGTTIENWV